MKLNLKMLAMMAVVLGVSGVVVAQGHGPYQPVSGVAGAAYAQDYEHHDDWDAPPQEFRDVQRRGFHDGVEGAKKDFDHHRAPDVHNRDEYRHPNVPPSDREDYREGYRRGYEVAMSHMMGQPYPR